MPISVVSLSKGSASGAAVSVGVPAGYASGDYFYAFTFADSDGAQASMSAPAGWTQVGATGGTTGGTGSGSGKVWVKVAASESTYSFPMPSGSDNQVTIIALRGVDTTTPVTASLTWNVATAAATPNLVAPTVSPAASGLLITFHTIMGATSGTTITAPSGMTGGGSSLDASNYTMNLVSYLAVASGATGTKTATSSTSGNTGTHGYLAGSIVIKDGPNAVSGSSTGASTFGSTVSGMRTGSTSGSGATIFGASASGLRTDSRGATGASVFSASVVGSTALLSNGSVTGATTFGAQVSGVINGGVYFRTPAYKQHPRVRHPLIARTWIPVGITLLKFGTVYRTYIDRDPELVAQADKAYIGGHLYFVDFDEANDLRDAGYGQLLSVDVPVSGDDDVPTVDYSQYGAGTYGTGIYGA